MLGIVTSASFYTNGVEPKTTTYPTLSIIPFFDVNGYRYQSLNDATSVFLQPEGKFIGSASHLRRTA